MTDDLKPCPFCGGKARAYFEENDDGLDFGVVSCEACWAQTCGSVCYWTSTEQDKQRSVQQAITRWNTRATLLEVQALVETVRIQSDLLHCGSCGERAKIIGARLHTALQAFQGAAKCPASSRP